jgi:two-component system response regulator AtoC
MEVNCSSFNENLLENELFGHERGAYTDATEAKKGLVELCDGGTLFLDEVADMSLPTQAKLLRFIDHRNFKRVGGATDISVDIRIVAATNKDLEAEVRGGRFRSDLYFRLKVVSIHLCPLRERERDVLLLASHFLGEFTRKFQKRFAEISPEATERMVEYAWPGNVRELRNLIERVVLLEEGERSRSSTFLPSCSVDARSSPAERESGRRSHARADRGRAHQRGVASHRRQQEPRGAHPRDLPPGIDREAETATHG